MKLDASLDRLSLSVTPGLGSRLTGKLLRQVGSPKDVFRASLTELEAFYLPSAPAIQSKHAHKYAEEEIAQVRKLGCRMLNWGEPKYPRRLLEIYDPSPLLCVRRDGPRSTGIRYRWWGRAGQTACRWRNGWRIKALAGPLTGRQLECSAREWTSFTRRKNKRIFKESGKARRVDQRIPSGHASRA